MVSAAMPGSSARAAAEARAAHDHDAKLHPSRVWEGDLLDCVVPRRA